MAKPKSDNYMSEIIKEMEEYTEAQAPAPSQYTLKKWAEKLKQYESDSARI